MQLRLRRLRSPEEDERERAGRRGEILVEFVKCLHVPRLDYAPMAPAITMLEQINEAVVQGKPVDS